MTDIILEYFVLALTINTYLELTDICMFHYIKMYIRKFSRNCTLFGRPPKVIHTLEELCCWHTGGNVVTVPAPNPH
jgi:hypothetical protein